MVAFKKRRGKNKIEYRVIINTLEDTLILCTCAIIHSFSICVSRMTSQEEFAILLFSPSVISDSFVTLYCSPPGSSTHGISQAGILEWVAISSSNFYSTAPQVSTGSLHSWKLKREVEWVEVIDNQAIDTFHFEKYMKSTWIQSEKFPASPLY